MKPTTINDLLRMDDGDFEAFRPQIVADVESDGHSWGYGLLYFSPSTQEEAARYEERILPLRRLVRERDAAKEAAQTAAREAAMRQATPARWGSHGVRYDEPCERCGTEGVVDNDTGLCQRCAG